MGSPRIVSSALYGDGFHRFLKILAAAEIPADIIRLPVHGFPFTDRRSEDITVLVILAAVKCFLYCVHFATSYDLIFLFWFTFRRSENKRLRPFNVLKLFRSEYTVKGQKNILRHR